jgi:glycosyltransferase involved in cell wall biosynthesis/GT2 family glycosyltransferase
MSPASPLVSVILAAHDAEAHVEVAVESMLRQTLADLELIVIDDGSRDRTPELLARIEDPRLAVLRNDERQGLAASLNLGLEHAQGRYVARLDADDVALPRRLERQVGRIRQSSRTVILGSAVRSFGDRRDAAHTMPVTPSEVRWHLLFGAPFYHPTVLLDREVLEREALRYDPRFLESEDYELWTRVLVAGEGENLAEPLVLYRIHPLQASQRSRELQRSFQLEIARREIARVAPELGDEEAELAWRVGAGEDLDADRLSEAASAYVELAHAFGRGHGPLGWALAHPLVRAARGAPLSMRPHLLRQAVELDPLLPAHALAARTARRAEERRTRREADAWLAQLETRDGGTAHPTRPIRVAAVFPEPTPYRAPLLDRVAALPELDLTVIYAAETVAARTWEVRPSHRAVFLRGLKLPGAARVLRHDYPVTPGVARALGRAQPDVVVISGWSTFAAQAAIAWCRLRGFPYILVVESHDEDPRPGWRRRVKGTIVPPIVRGASGALVTGTVAGRSLVERGARPEDVRVFANTVDVAAFAEHADRLAERRDELRDALGGGPDDIVVLSVGRLVPDKAMDVLVRATARADDLRLLLVLAGSGPERSALERLAQALDVRLLLVGDTPWDRIVELYAAADVFALLSEREPWGVVVNEAAACGLPLVLSDRVGAAHDLLRDGENGVLVPAGDVEASAGALQALAADPSRRQAFGVRSRELASAWGYEPSVENFLAAVREASARSRR